jgi:hypothetical protein
MMPDLSKLLDTEKDALILTLSARLDAALKLIAELQARIEELIRPGKPPTIPACRHQRARSRTRRISRSSKDLVAAALGARAVGVP